MQASKCMNTHFNLFFENSDQDYTITFIVPGNSIIQGKERENENNRTNKNLMNELLLQHWNTAKERTLNIQYRANGSMKRVILLLIERLLVAQE